ncbi:Cyclic nucleotide-binding protein [Pseudocohnilembus persalinus]|uniref:cAMP-dependent protein kinase regulatory subunit n=1 Tax=Pseudocohnilembus persalinus TaxID=266149 RepID=A0A0V0QXA7_PSEPJ|nr:Cyclic nucleotide-binding protein [Pseudocohnilembus persalinus]|eukprot:KRX06887.1 Cyclic nucleotide-binding protein [Pseudocohnilembus persalinus]
MIIFLKRKLKLYFHLNTPDWIKNNGTMFMSKEEIQNYQNKDKNNKQNVFKSQNEEQVSSDEENEEDEEDYIDEVPLEILQNKGKQGMRTSVSAEVYGKFNQQKEFQPRNIHKNSEQRERINKRIQSCFMFMGLTDSDKEIIVMAMEEKKFNPGDWIIKQGEDGNELYVVDSGELDCFKKFSKNEEPKYLKTYNIGESFGELSLLYNSPRQASIRAKTDSVLWALDRETFNNIIKQATISKRKKYQDFMLQVDLLKEMSEYEREQVCDSLRVMNFKKGEFVVKQGEQGDMFYMVEDGDLVALKIMQPGGDYQEVMSYTTGMYFGELALLKNQPRAASILCKTDCQLVGLDRYSFKRLLGNLEDILKRNSEQYAKYVN